LLRYPTIDPVAVQVGPLAIHWYGLTYLAAFAFAWWLATLRARRPDLVVQRAQVDDLIFYAAMGVVLGGRLGYVLFYGLDRWLVDPLWLFRVWEGGMAFHGGLLGVLVAVWLFARKYQLHYADVLDFVAPLVPLGLAFGRLGNFIGQELWGRAATVPWAMVFPADPLQLARHPSQLYQAALEGLLLFLLLLWYSRRPRPRLAVGGLFLIGYGVLRFTAEFFREPDAHIGFIAMGWMTQGQLLCLPMVLCGLWLWWRAQRGAADAARKSSS
jgi:phosphatidylglycerol:prolipoprotein diacylglycerol transferase